MLSVANNYKHIYEMYNFDFDPEPGSVQYKVDQRIKRVRSVGLGRRRCMSQLACVKPSPHHHICMLTLFMPPFVYCTGARAAHEPAGPHGGGAG